MNEQSVESSDDHFDVAIIGMAGRFPGAKNVAEYWLNIRSGVDSITRLTREELIAQGIDPSVVDNPNYVPTTTLLEDADCFDAGLFAYSPKEAEMLDPQSRVFLECAWEALEHSGYDPARYDGTIGVYAASSLNTYMLGHLHPRLNLDCFTLAGGNLQPIISNGADFPATRVSYKLNLKGPAINVQTACSSSLVAVHMARQSILDGECDMAMAGGVSIYLPIKAGYLYEEGLILSPEGVCRPFDHRANGTVFGRGAGIVVLKLLEDAVEDGDRILAVIKGSAINNDGADKVGYTAPSVRGQAEVVAEAIANASVPPESITYIEAHGTGTQQGDPIEVAALRKAFSIVDDPGHPCLLGSVKANIGHMDTASGVAGLIKVVMMLGEREIPQCLHFEKANPNLQLEDSRFRISNSLKPWKSVDQPLRAGVSSFGMGGTNAHLILEEAPDSSGSNTDADRLQILTLSARTPDALDELRRSYCNCLSNAPAGSLESMCFTANTGRTRLRHRLAVVGNSTNELRALLESGKSDDANIGAGSGLAAGMVEPGKSAEVVFMFTGNGVQYPGMTRDLFDSEPVFRESILESEKLLTSILDRPLTKLLFDESDECLLRTDYAQPCLFAVEYALARLWMSWNVRPSALIGHSLGEYVAACVAGVFSLREGLELVSARGRLFQELRNTGKMAAVFSTEEQVEAIVSEVNLAHGEKGPFICIAGINGPRNIVISGPDNLIEAAIDRLADSSVEARELNVSHAFHSELVEPMLDAFSREFETIALNEPGIPLVSNLTGEFVDPSMLCDPRYWIRHVREPVRFSKGVAVLDAAGYKFFVEVGPHPVLIGMAAQVACSPDVVWVSSTHRERDDREQILESIGRLYVNGIDIDWRVFYENRPVRRVSLPVYPFERTRHWIERQAGQGTRISETARAVDHPLLDARLKSPLGTITFESRIGVESPAYAADHCVFGTTIFPATGYVELATAASCIILQADSVEIRDLKIREAMVLEPNAARTLQVILEPEIDLQAKFAIHALEPGTDSDSWILYATGLARVLPVGQNGETGLSASLEESRTRCGKPISGEDYYSELADLGLNYGESFRGIRTLCRRDGEAVVDVAVPGKLQDEIAAYHAHPALLDACLQLAFAAIPESWQRAADENLYLPTAVESVRVMHPLSAELHSHLAIRNSADESPNHCVCDVQVFDDTGTLCAEISGILMQRTPKALLNHDSEINRLLYETHWREKSLRQFFESEGLSPEVVDPPKLASNLMPLIEPLRERHGMSAMDELAVELDRISVAFAASTLTSLGFEMHPGSMLDDASPLQDLGIVPAHSSMFTRLLAMLEEDGYLNRHDKGWEVIETPESFDAAARCAELALEHPECRGLLSMVTKCGINLADVLCGKADPLDLLFSAGSLDEVQSIYQTTPFTFVYNELVGEAVKQAVSSLPAGKPLRVVEIGAGTGGTTRYVIPELRAGNTEYIFTDVSQLFLANAQENFKDFPFIEYQILDIGEDPLSQGLTAHGADLVIASNVLHATPDLRKTMGHVLRLLAPNGLLVMVEGISRQRWVDLIFGLTEGWWCFTDYDLRPSYPLISQRQWCSVLRSVGFSEPRTLPGEGNDEAIFQQAVILARGPDAEEIAEQERNGAKSGTWVILGDRPGLGNALEARLVSGGWNCCLLNRTDSADDSDSLDLVASSRPIRGVISLRALDAPADECMNSIELSQWQEYQLGGALNLVQQLARRKETPPLWIVTRGAQSVGQTPSVSAAQAPLVGMRKVIGVEHPELHCKSIDLDPFPESNEADRLLAEILGPDGEDQIALRHGGRLVSRLGNLADSKQVNHGSQDPFRLAVPASGVLEDLHREKYVRRVPRSGEVEIQVLATGLNFKDVLTAMDAYPGAPDPLGGECAGRIVSIGDQVTDFAIGDEVMAFCSGAMASFVSTDAANVVRKPAEMSIEEAATIPGVFITASYCLEDLAKIRAGERVLIHAGAGGVGMAAIQIAQRAGAEIFATAGSDWKRSALDALGVKLVMDSRSLSFGDEIMEHTNGEGVHVVLNSLAGESIEKSFSVLMPGGRFIEIGKNEIWSRETVEQLDKSIDYHIVDVAEYSRNNPDRTSAVLRALVSRFETGELRTLPLRSFPVEEAVTAFRFMAGASHIGKLCLSWRHLGVEDSTGLVIRPDATYWITGGLGGLGLATARWLVKHGARHLVLSGRREPGAYADGAIAELKADGVQISVMTGDVASMDDVSRILSAISESMPNLRGVIHAAGTLADGMIIQQSWSRFRTVLDAKVYGAWNLHVQTADLPLDFFILYSSVAALLGTAGQANHAAANAFLDALAHKRRGQGLPALSVNWGAWGEIGTVADEAIEQRLSTRGISTITPDQGFALLDESLRRNLVQVGGVDIDLPMYLRQFDGREVPAFFEELIEQGDQPDGATSDAEQIVFLSQVLEEAPRSTHRAEIRKYIEAQIKAGLGIADEEKLNPNEALSEFGVDSLMAVELRHRLAAGLGPEFTLPATLLFDYPTITALTGHFADELLGIDQQSEKFTAEKQVSEMAIHDDIDSLSDAEAEELLIRELEAGGEGR